jgi:hypothetical protein
LYSSLYKYNLDEQGTPFCCGGPIPDEYASQYGGYSDDMYGAAESINQMYDYQ